MERNSTTDVLTRGLTLVLLLGLLPLATWCDLRQAAAAPAGDAYDVTDFGANGSDKKG